MQGVPKLRAIVLAIAHHYGMALDQPGAHLRLALTDHGQLVLENIGAQRVSVTNYVESGHSRLADPQVVLYTAHPTPIDGQSQVAAAWVPLEITERWGGWRLYAEVDAHGEPVLYDRLGQAALAEYCDQIVAHHLAEHGWLTDAVRQTTSVPDWDDEEIHARDIRLEELYAPIWLPTYHDG